MDVNGFKHPAPNWRLVVARSGWVLLVLVTQLGGLPAGGILADGKAYTIKWYAADPEVNNAPYLPTYAKWEPSQLACPAPSGGSGTAADPLADAVAYGPTGATLDALTALQPKDMALGQIVPFEAVITVDGTTAPEVGVIEFTAYWDTHTNPGDDFGYDPAYGVYCAFVDTADAGASDPGTDAKVDAYSYTVLNPGTSSESIQGTFQVSGLDDGDRVLVEIWVVLKSTIPLTSNGNVASGLVDAHTVYDPPDSISAGSQTVGLVQVQAFFTEQADLSVVKADSPDPVTPGAQLQYDIVVTNNSVTIVANGVTVTDILDPNTSYLSASGATCSEASGTVTCAVGALPPGQTATINLLVSVSATAPIDGSVSSGTCTVGSPGVDLCNAVSVTAITADPNLANNSDSEPTDVVSTTAVTVADFGASAADSGILVIWRTATELDMLGFNLYRAGAPDAPRSRLNGELIAGQVPPGSPVGAEYEYADVRVEPGATYYYWLEAVDIYGRAAFHGPVSAQAPTYESEPGWRARLFLPIVSKQ
jgi:uncharacterized repeat protein (TIGR01451 family)